MDSISKIMIILCLLVIVGVKLKGGGVSAVNLFPKKVTVQITNKLSMKQLDLHCKDKHHDLGLITLNVNETYRFRFYTQFFTLTTLYFCHFVWSNGDHHFDIYVQKRDLFCFHYRCSWEILENGPCQLAPGTRHCFMWN